MWIELKVELTPLSPIHIGSLRYGFINRTKLYIPYYTVHSAINKFIYLNYKLINIKNFLKSTSFFFYERDKILTPTQIKSKYVGSRTSVSIDNRTRTARRGMLYNTEYILPSDILVAKGSIFVRQDYIDKVVNILLKFKRNILIGGELKAGFGKVEVNIVDEIKNPSFERELKAGDTLFEMVRIEPDKDYTFLDGEKEVVFLRKTRSINNHGNWSWYEGLFFSPFSKVLRKQKINLLDKKFV